jgi:hypothetical protein
VAEKRKAPAARAAARDSVAETSAQEAERLGKQHMTVAANRAKESLARGNKARELQQAAKWLKGLNPFGKIGSTLGGK